MASRRMFSKNITNSAKFIKMPSETQALYFHLCMHADDDWVVEAFTVMRMIWSSEDNIRLLHAKWFIHILNEELVSYVLDWNEHNLLRADRKIDSLYQWLLLQILPSIDIVKPKERADIRAKRNLKNMWIWQIVDVQWTANGRPVDDVGEVSIGKVSIDKNIINKEKDSNPLQTNTLKENPPIPRAPHARKKYDTVDSIYEDITEQAYIDTVFPKIDHEWLKIELLTMLDWYKKKKGWVAIPKSAVKNWLKDKDYKKTLKKSQDDIPYWEKEFL